MDYLYAQTLKRNKEGTVEIFNAYKAANKIRLDVFRVSYTTSEVQYGSEVKFRRFGSKERLRCFKVLRERVRYG